MRSFVHSPNLLPAGSAGTNYTGIISASDIFPTFCAIAGVPLPSQASAPNQLDGMSTSTQEVPKTLDNNGMLLAKACICSLL
eukprot:COSAG04_NODE_2180_length_4609_cov_5.154989_6_plen_82_part_00